MKIIISRSEDKGDQQHVFEISHHSSLTIVELLQLIQEEYDPTLSFIYSCKNGLCGLCTVIVNDRPLLGCLTKLTVADHDVVTIKPISIKKQVSDLICY